MSEPSSKIIIHLTDEMRRISSASKTARKPKASGGHPCKGKEKPKAIQREREKGQAIIN